MAMTMDAARSAARPNPERGSDAAERARAFHQARRHSLLVKMLRVALRWGRLRHDFLCPDSGRELADGTRSSQSGRSRSPRTI